MGLVQKCLHGLQNVLYNLNIDWNKISGAYEFFKNGYA